MELLITAFSKENNGGVYAANFDPRSGTFSTANQLATLHGCLHAHWEPESRQLIVAGNATEPAEGQQPGQVTVLEVAAESQAARQTGQFATNGRTACYVGYNADSRSAYIAHYSSASIAAVATQESRAVSPVVYARGGSSVDPRRQTEPHPHCSYFNSAESSLWVVDLGTDEVVCYPVKSGSGELNADAGLVLKMAPGAGPRHVIFHPRLPVAYVTNELNSTITVLLVREDSWQVGETYSTVVGESTKEVENYISTAAVHPSGRYLLVANRGDDSIATFQLNGDGIPVAAPELTPAEGAFPTFLSFDTDGQWLFVANMKSSEVVAFSVGEQNDTLKLQARDRLSCPMPTWVLPIR